MNLLKTKPLLLASIVISAVLLSACDTNDNNEKPDGNLEDVKLNDFPLTETEYLSIDIKHPEMANGEETAHGEITITIPHSHQSLLLSLGEFKLDQSKYTISPARGIIQDFATGSVVYTISAVRAPGSAVHYDVTVVHGGEPFIENKNITGFKFEAAKNPGLSETIEALKIVDYENSSDAAIYVIVPVGTDFSRLTPTITFDAAKLNYRTNGELLPFPANGLTVDFKYPAQFSLQAENSLGVKSKIYHVIVDVKNPIKLQETITTPLVKKGDGFSAESFSAIVTWTNQGNYPIRGMSPELYKDRIYPVDGVTSNVITATLSNPIPGLIGVLPGETGHLNVRVMHAPITGVFSTTAVFSPSFNLNTKSIYYWISGDLVENLYEKQTLVISATIED